jgi:isopenicillin N synthase-like dioxygenase
VAQDENVPVLDISTLVGEPGDSAQVVSRLARACREWGFFYINHHGIDPELERLLEQESRRFFGCPPAQKQKILMVRGGKAWRGYFEVGGELTSRMPDYKEGLYFGQELSPDHPLVCCGTPMHGPNLFPTDMPQFRTAVLAYIDALTQLGHVLMGGIALGLGLEQHYFAQHFTGDPLVLFRIFHYPPSQPQDNRWGVGKHTDYGLLTILKQDEVGGLEVRSKTQWLAVPPIPGTFLCNVGDMLERLTGGYYRSAPHRVRNRSGRSRLSFPFFFDPNFQAKIEPIPGCKQAKLTAEARWDGARLSDFQGTYGDYLLAKVGRVFPQL